MLDAIGIQNAGYLVLSAVGVFLVIAAIVNIRKANASQGWNGVQGKITESYVRRQESSDGEGGTSTSYYPEIRYTYSVMGVEYQGKNIAFGMKSSSRKSAQALVEKYPAETSVIVYYNPQKPQQAVLERRSSSGWLQIVIGMALLATGIFLAVK